ncbi:hypothetical protein [Aeromicrobium sp.]|uniref:hypothetical protein n=1 Tax=Aeromicrobium sp. TaxID=1871063 RepID=UPI002FC59183
MTSSDGPAKLSKAEVERRRRAAELLGDLLPDTTRDETAEGWGEKDTSSRDDDYLRDVPPHHG